MPTIHVEEVADGFHCHSCVATVTLPSNEPTAVADVRVIVSVWPFGAVRMNMSAPSRFRRTRGRFDEVNRPHGP